MYTGNRDAVKTFFGFVFTSRCKLFMDALFELLVAYFLNMDVVLLGSYEKNLDLKVTDLPLLQFIYLQSICS